MGANCAQDTPLMKQYTKHLLQEMKLIEGTKLTTDQGHEVEFSFQLIPADMKWLSSMSGELNTCAIYFSPFANVNLVDQRQLGNHGIIPSGFKLQKKLQSLKPS